MSGLFDRLAVRISGNPPGLASPRVPTRFEPLPEEAGFAAPQSATFAGDVAPQADMPDAEAYLALAPVPTTSMLIPPVANTVHPPRTAAARADMPRGRRAEIAGARQNAMAATVLPVGQAAAAIRRRAADALAMPGSEAAPAPVASASSRAADANGGSQPSTAPNAAASSANAPAPLHGTESVAAIDLARSRPAIDPARTRVAALAPGPPSPLKPNDLHAQPGVPQVAHIASAADASNSIPAVPPVAPATGPKQEVVRIDPASTKRVSQPLTPEPGDAVARPAAYAASATPSPRVPSPAHMGPIVEVHIGSVEIRAAAQPVLPAAASGPAARSLDDFLAGRRPQ